MLCVALSEMMRLTVDYRKLNERTLDDRYPMPMVDDVVERAAQGHVFSIFDVKMAFVQPPPTSRQQAVHCLLHC